MDLEPPLISDELYYSFISFGRYIECIERLRERFFGSYTYVRYSRPEKKKNE